MRQISQTLRSLYEHDQDAYVEFLLHKLEEFKEVRCKRQGAKDSEINAEFQEIALAALEFEADHFEKKLDEIQLHKVPGQDDLQRTADRMAKLSKIMSNKDLIVSLRQFVESDSSVGQSSRS